MAHALLVRSTAIAFPAGIAKSDQVQIIYNIINTMDQGLNANPPYSL